MNAKRRNEIKKLIERIEELVSDVGSVQYDEQESLDNLPESLQYSERAEQMQEYIDNMDDVLQSLNEAKDWLEDIVC